MNKDFIDNLIEVVEVKGKNSSVPFSEKKNKGITVAGVDVTEQRKLSPEHVRKIAEAGVGRRHTEETKRKIAKAHLGRVRPPISEETRQRLREAQANRVRKPLSEETKRKISEAHIARNKALGRGIHSKTYVDKANKKRVVTEETRRKISEAQKGKVISEETKIKMREARQNMSEETKNRMIQALRGQVFTEERRRKMREAHKGRDYNRPIMTPNGEFVSKESLKKRLIEDGVSSPTDKIREWFKLYPNEYYYIKKIKTN